MPVTPFAQAHWFNFSRSLQIFQTNAGPVFDFLVSAENINAVNYNDFGLKSTNSGGLSYEGYSPTEIPPTNLYDATYSIWAATTSNLDGFPTGQSAFTIRTTAAHAGGVRIYLDYADNKCKVSINEDFASETVQYNFADLGDTPIANGTILESAALTMSQVQFGYSFDASTGIFVCVAGGVQFASFKLASVNTPQAIQNWGPEFGIEPAHGNQDLRTYDKVVDLTLTISDINQYHNEVQPVPPGPSAEEIRRGRVIMGSSPRL